MNTILNTDEVIDSRDIIERLEELESEREDLVEAVTDSMVTVMDTVDEVNEWCDRSDTDFSELREFWMYATGRAQESPEERLKSILNLTAALDVNERANRALFEWDQENLQDLKLLEKVKDQGEGYGDWAYGEPLIREDHFAESVNVTPCRKNSIRRGGHGGT